MANSIKKYSDYVRLRHNNPCEYYTSETQRQMYEDQVNLGSAVYYNISEQLNDQRYER